MDQAPYPTDAERAELAGIILDSIAERQLRSLRAAWDAPYDGDATARRALTVELAAATLSANLGTKIGDLTVYVGGWSREAGQRADAVAESGTSEWAAALGAYEHCTLTSDGLGADRSRWCACPVLDLGDSWVRYEHWTAEGRSAHGFVCRDCRRLLQTG